MSRARVALALRRPGRAEVAAVSGWLGAVNEAAVAMASPRWAWLLVTPLGLPDRAWLERQLGARGVRVEARVEVRPMEAHWPRISTAVQVGTRSANLRRAVLYEAAWQALFPDARAEAWALSPDRRSRVVSEKRLLRTGMDNLAITFGAGSGDRGVLHAFHLADPQDVAAEARRFEAALHLLEDGVTGRS